MEWERNKAKLLQCNREPDHPVARIKAIDNGRHAQKADSNKAGGLLPLLYICRESKGPAYMDEDPTLVPIVPVSRCTDCLCRCKRVQVPLRLSWGTTIHKCQGMTVGTGEAFRYIVIHPGKHDFEAKNPGALFVALSRAKSAGGEGVDPDFAFHEDVLVNEDRLRPVNTPTTRARTVEMERLHVLATQSQEREILTPAYRDGIFLRLVEWAQSQSH